MALHVRAPHVPLTENTGNGSSNGEKKWHTVLQQASKLLFFAVNRH